MFLEQAQIAKIDLALGKLGGSESAGETRESLNRFPRQ